MVAHKIGVICKSCGERTEVEDEYIPGIRATEMGAFYKPLGKQLADVVNVVWQKALSCEIRVAGKPTSTEVTICSFTTTRPPIEVRARSPNVPAIEHAHIPLQKPAPKVLDTLNTVPGCA